jgi:hypothetical protein
MPVQGIISAIDAYIAQLKEARDLIASVGTPSETSNKGPGRRKAQKKLQSIEVPVAAAVTQSVAVQIIPARAPRQGRRLAKPVSQTFSALGGPVPTNPVVIRSSDLARLRAASSQVHSVQMSNSPRGALEELAQEVAKRLSWSGSLQH